MTTRKWISNYFTHSNVRKLFVTILSITFVSFLVVVLFDSIMFDKNKSNYSNNTPSTIIEHTIHSLQYNRENNNIDNTDTTDFIYFIKNYGKFIKKDDTLLITITSNNSNDVPNSDISPKDDNILSHISNILNDTSNILTIVIITLTIFGVGGIYGLYRYFTKFKELGERIQAADRNVLDSALTTISAVPFIEVTQITSSQYYRAIENITKTVRDQWNIVYNEPKYAPLLLVSALKDWKEKKRDYFRIINKLERARELVDLAYDSAEKDEVRFHLARAYKQRGYERYQYKEFDRADSDFNNCIEMAYSEENRKLNAISIALIKNDGLKNTILSCFNNRYNSTEEILKSYIDNEIILYNLLEITAVTTIIIDKNLHSEINPDVLKNSGNKLLKWFEGEITHKKALNIKVSWYHTMYQIAVKCDLKNAKSDYKKIFIKYKNFAIKNNEIHHLFNCFTLTEIPLESINLKYI